MKGIIYGQAMIASSEDPETSMKTVLHEQVEHVTLGATDEHLTYGNEHGLDILDRLISVERDNLKSQAKMDILARENFKTQTTLADLVQTTSSRINLLEAQNRALAISSNGYMQIRRRFLEVFKREWGITPEHGYSFEIHQGNKAAHHGDAVTDAIITKQDNRDDKSAYEILYGLTPDEVLAISTLIIQSIW